MEKQVGQFGRSTRSPARIKMKKVAGPQVLKSNLKEGTFWGTGCGLLIWQITTG